MGVVTPAQRLAVERSQLGHAGRLVPGPLGRKDCCMLGNTKAVDIRALEMLSATVDSGGVRRAAFVLGVTPGTVSRALDRLEDEVGVLLLERHRGSAPALTEAGTALLGEARIALAHLGRGLLMARQRRGQPGLRLGLPPLPPVAAVTRLVRRVQEVAGNAAVQLSPVSWRATFSGEAVRSGRLDAVVSLLPGTNPDLCEMAVEELARVAVLSAADPLARRRRVVPADLDGHRAVVAAELSSTAAGFWGLDPLTDGRRRRFARRASSVSGMLSAIANGRGFSTMPSLTPQMWQRSDLAWPGPASTHRPHGWA